MEKTAVVRLVAPNDREGFASAVESVLSRPALRRSLVEAGRRHVAGFSWQACAAATVAVYTEVIKEAATR